MDAAALVTRARRAAGLTQRALAERATIDQAVVARVERGQTVPRADTLARLLEAAGYELRLDPAPRADVDRAQIRALIALPDRERERFFIESNRNMLRMFHER